MSTFAEILPGEQIAMLPIHRINIPILQLIPYLCPPLLCILSSLRLVFFFIGHWMYHCPYFHVVLDQCETMFHYDDTEMVRRFSLYCSCFHGEILDA